MFTSDNGPLYDHLGGTGTEFFNSAAGFRGRKGSYYEGGFRVPCLVRWKGQITPRAISNRVTGFEDWLPTLLGRRQEPRPFLYRESPGYGGQQCVRVGDWKLVRQNLNPAPGPKATPPPTLELYDLAQDRSETTEVAPGHPEVVARLIQIAREQHVKSELWPIRLLDAAQPEAGATGEAK